MATRKLAKSEYENYFNALSKQLGATSAEVEVAGLEIGDQIEAEWLPLTGLVYDRKDDLFEIVLGETIDHLILHPQEIYVEESLGSVQSVEVVGRDDTRHIAKLKKALALPKPG